MSAAPWGSTTLTVTRWLRLLPHAGVSGARCGASAGTGLAGRSATASAGVSAAGASDGAALAVAVARLKPNGYADGGLCGRVAVAISPAATPRFVLRTTVLPAAFTP